MNFFGIFTVNFNQVKSGIEDFGTYFDILLSSWKKENWRFYNLKRKTDKIVCQEYLDLVNS